MFLITEVIGHPLSSQAISTVSTAWLRNHEVSLRTKTLADGTRDSPVASRSTRPSCVIFVASANLTSPHCTKNANANASERLSLRTFTSFSRRKTSKFKKVTDTKTI